MDILKFLIKLILHWKDELRDLIIKKFHFFNMFLKILEEIGTDSLIWNLEKQSNLMELLSIIQKISFSKKILNHIKKNAIFAKIMEKIKVFGIVKSSFASQIVNFFLKEMSFFHFHSKNSSKSVQKIQYKGSPRKRSLNLNLLNENDIIPLIKVNLKKKKILINNFNYN